MMKVASGKLLLHQLGKTVAGATANHATYGHGPIVPHNINFQSLILVKDSLSRECCTKKASGCKGIGSSELVRFSRSHQPLKAVRGELHHLVARPSKACISPAR